MLENCEPVRLSIDVFTVRINFNMNMSHTKEIPTRPIYDVLSNKCEFTNVRLNNEKKKLLWTWIYANLHTPAKPTFYENIRNTMWWRKKNEQPQSFIHPSISYMSENLANHTYEAYEITIHTCCVLGAHNKKMKFILRITMHFGPELNDIHMVNNNTSHKKIGSKQRKNLKQPNHLRFNGRTMARCDTFFRGIFW